MILPIISSVLLTISIAILFGLTPDQVADDLMALITPRECLRDTAKNLRGGKKKKSLYKTLLKMKTSLAVTGKSGQFTAVCCLSLLLFAAGIILSILIKNVYLMPALSAAFALFPFFYVSSMLSYYDKHTKEELETTLSIITTSYIRVGDIVTAVRENLRYIKSPLRDIFSSFEFEATALTSNMTRAILNLRNKIDDDIFDEWCDTLIQCQDDSTQKDTLLSVVGKLADVRQVNSELSAMLAAARNEYWVMVALVVGNVPLLYVLNKDWYHTLVYSIPGKLVCGVCGIVILITALFMMKYTKPIEYKK